MKSLLLAIAFFGMSAHAYSIRADRDDVACASHWDRNGGMLDVKVKGKVVLSIYAGVAETGANAGEAFCNGVLEFARIHNRQGIFIDVDTTKTLTGRTMTVENLYCQ